MLIYESLTELYIFRLRFVGSEYRVVAMLVERAASGVVFDIHFQENSTFDTRVTLLDDSTIDEALKQAAASVLRRHGVTSKTQEDDLYPQYF